MRPLVTLLLLFSSAQAASLFEQRQATLASVDGHGKAHPRTLQRCTMAGGEWKTDVLAFPAGRADRLYIFAYGTARGYQVRRGVAHLVWCARAVNVPPDGWTYPSNVERVLIFPLRTFAGTLPREGALDVFRSFAGRLTTRKVDAAGRVICERTHDTRNPRSAFEFQAIDTCG
ncbi:hypothetical protein [Deinococcus hohokamensis]|uniref:Uncharacterized protein n=1 Tax=Deinococcus hohokamensis TaxID=309883 RepID=A0ABV9I7K1_9DEIO